MASRKRAQLIVGAVFTALALFVVFFTVFIILSSFKDLEEKDAAHRMEQVQEALYGHIDDLDSKAGDWSIWDDTYRFMAGQYPDYVQVNMQDVSFVELDVNLMLFVDGRGGLVLAKAVDLEDAREVTVPADLEGLIYPGSPLIDYPHGG